MLFVDIIRGKRNGGELPALEIETFVNGLAGGSLPAEQASALAMAIFLNAMTAAEASKLTLGMVNSGTVLNWEDAGLDGPVVDKHSTGGVGDKVSFLLELIAAACGCYVRMISGRGLGLWPWYMRRPRTTRHSPPGHCSKRAKLIDPNPLQRL